jgi:hypothetical protein
MHGMIPTGIVSVQYADDTLLFLKNNLDNVVNLKWILSCFEQMFGMRINFHKCDLIAINVEEEEAQIIAQSLCCRLGGIPHEIFRGSSSLQKAEERRSPTSH